MTEWVYEITSGLPWRPEPRHSLGVEAGVDVTLEMRDDMPHVCQAFLPFLPEAGQVLDHRAQFVQKHTI